jgi:hypothetical protein
MSYRAIVFDIGGPLDMEFAWEIAVDSAIASARSLEGIRVDQAMIEEASEAAVAAFAPDAYAHMIEALCVGDRYEGAWRDGKPSGQGVLSSHDGDRYEGAWSAGKPNGQGTKTVAGGEAYSGVWKNGCFQDGERRATVRSTPTECGFE